MDVSDAVAGAVHLQDPLASLLVHAASVVCYGDQDVVTVLPAGHREYPDPRRLPGVQTVENGVFRQGLEDHVEHRVLQGTLFDLIIHIKGVGVHDLLDGNVGSGVLQFRLYGGEGLFREQIDEMRCSMLNVRSKNIHR